MKKLKLLSTCVCFIALSSTYGQTVNVDNYFSGLDVVSEKNKLPDDVIGSSYLVDTFQPAKISTDDKTYAIRYNAYRDEMEIEHENQTYYLTKTAGFKVTFMSDNKVYQAFPLAENASKNGFFVVLSSGDKVSLLVKEKITYIEGTESTTGYDSAQPAQFKRQKDEYFISRDGTSTSELSIKKKDLLNYFGNHSKQVEAYMKSEKLNPKKSEDLGLIFDYYNSL